MSEYGRCGCSHYLDRSLLHAVDVRSLQVENWKKARTYALGHLIHLLHANRKHSLVCVCVWLCVCASVLLQIALLANITADEDDDDDDDDDDIAF